jgi:hypothetical protein
VEREIRAQDSHGRRKYLREFHEAFRSYDSVVDAQQILSAVDSADVVLIGDYHALPAAQRYAATLLEQRALSGGRPVVLAVETIFARDQHILDEWWRREIHESELRERVRFDLDWGYDWSPFRELLVAARDHADGVYGLDCMPRDDLRKIGTRDRHAVEKIAEVRERHPNAVVFVLFGESHLAPAHLPKLLRREMPEARLLTILQNVDALYWRAAGESAEKVEAVRVSREVMCVFNATPLEKYESYRLFLDQWSRCEDSPDFAPTIYNLIDSLADFLEINRYSPHNGTQPKFLVDLLPEIHQYESDTSLRNFLSRKGIDQDDLEASMSSAQERGSIYVPIANALYVREFQMMHASEDATRFLHHACMGLPRRGKFLGPGDAAPSEILDRLYAAVLEDAIAFFGSRVLDPSRPEPQAVTKAPLSRVALESAVKTAVRAGGSKSHTVTKEWGYRIGSEIYRAYLAGKVSHPELRRLFLLHLYEPGIARKACAAVIGRLRKLLGDGPIQ